MAKRPNQLPLLPRLSTAQIQTAKYVGSPEHKNRAWWGGLPQAYVGPDGKAKRPKKQHTTICPLIGSEDQATATEWVQEALTKNQVKFVEGDKIFPRYVWLTDESGQEWVGRCVNSVLGQYKGWPVKEEERRAIFSEMAG